MPWHKVRKIGPGPRCFNRGDGERRGRNRDVPDVAWSQRRPLSDPTRCGPATERRPSRGSAWRDRPWQRRGPGDQVGVESDAEPLEVGLQLVAAALRGSAGPVCGGPVEQQRRWAGSGRGERRMSRASGRERIGRRLGESASTSPIDSEGSTKASVSGVRVLLVMVLPEGSRSAKAVERVFGPARSNWMVRRWQGCPSWTTASALLTLPSPHSGREAWRTRSPTDHARGGILDLRPASCGPGPCSRDAAGDRHTIRTHFSRRALAACGAGAGTESARGRFEPALCGAGRGAPCDPACRGVALGQNAGGPAGSTSHGATTASRQGPDCPGPSSRPSIAPQLVGLFPIGFHPSLIRSTRRCGVPRRALPVEYPGAGPTRTVKLIGRRGRGG